MQFWKAMKKCKNRLMFSVNTYKIISINSLSNNILLPEKRK